MNSCLRFCFVYRTIEQDVYGRPVTDIDIQRAFRRYLHVTNQEEK
jgi:hypothetical protein